MTSEIENWVRANWSELQVRFPGAVARGRLPEITEDFRVTNQGEERSIVGVARESGRIRLLLSNGVSHKLAERQPLERF
ncbi:hypothetical protein [Streptomyces sp. NPDC046979]|uniref:hypothetical protein n=1 Tax=Streptomyces sp. NPDC046979 TaxID=3154604 RepID=UPI003406C48B